MSRRSRSSSTTSEPDSASIEYTSDDLGYLLNELHSASPKWKIIGIQLQIPEAELDLIRADNTNSQECFIAIFTRRFRQGTIRQSDLSEILKMPSVGENALADKLERRFNEPQNDTDVLNITSTNVLHYISPRISDTVFPYTHLKKAYPTHVPFGVFIILQIFTLLDDKVFRPRSYSIEEYANRVVIFILYAFVMVVVPCLCYAQLCYLGKLEKKFFSSEETNETSLELSRATRNEMKKIFRERKVSLDPLKFISEFKPLFKCKGIEITAYQVLIHSLVFPLLLYYLGVFNSSRSHRLTGAIESWRQRLQINGIEILEVWECTALSITLFLSGTLKDIYCFENHMATLLSETQATVSRRPTPLSRAIFTAVRSRWQLIDIGAYALTLSYAILTTVLLFNGESFIPKYLKMKDLDQSVWNILTVLVAIMQFGASSAHPDVKAFSIIGYFALPLIKFARMYIKGDGKTSVLLQDGFHLQTAPGNILLVLYTSQLVSVLSWLLCLFHCYWRQNELKTWSYHSCLTAIALIVVCLCVVTIKEFRSCNLQ